MTTIVDNIRLDENIEKGAEGGPTFSTTVFTFSSGAEQRNQNWARVRSSYDISYGIQQKAQYAAVRSFFYARRGRFRGFLFKDWTDYFTTAEPIATADGVGKIYQLVVTYTDDVSPFTRRITRPLASSLVMYVDGVSKAYSLGSLGVVTLTDLPTIGQVVTADFQFDVPVRFDQDDLPVTAQTEDDGTYPSIKIIELPE